MKGIILAGGLGTRLRPLTLDTNKHLLPIAGRPMILYPVDCLVNAGIERVLIVTGNDHAEAFARLLGDGRALGLRELAFERQQGEGGIADALRSGERFAQGERVCVVLGDNLVERSIRGAADRFRAQPSGARVLLHDADEPERFGIARLEQGRIIEIVEKPAQPPGRKAVIGIYFYPSDVFDICRSLRPSPRGELEITDVNNVYARRGELHHEEHPGWWTDAGTIESLNHATRLVASTGTNRP